ncbi:MAG: hypothetical protein IJ955_00960 [Oscillospiraceae bacterium]|nr:hypothetical protein [Oscillospiraceae bacterium]
MLPKSYLIAKWSVYALATLFLAAFQHLIFNNIPIWGVTAFLYPLLPALVSSYEGLERGSKFSLTVGIICDILIYSPFNGFYAITFTIIGILSAQIGKNLLSPDGWLCGFAVSSLGMVLVNIFRLAIYFLSGKLEPVLMGQIALVETVITLPVFLIAFPLYRWIHKHCAVDY